MVAMRLLFLTKRHYTNKDLIADRFGRLFHLPVQLGRLGHDVSVIALDYRGSSQTEIAVDGVEFFSLPVRGASFPSSWRRMSEQARSLRPHAVIGSADTHLGWMARRIARKREALFVFDLYDNYAAFASARIPGMKALFERLVGAADLVVGASEPLVRLAHRHNSKVALVVNGVDRDLFRPIDKATARARLGFDIGRKLIGYLGSIEPDRGIETLVDAVGIVRSHEPDTRLLVAGADTMGFGWDPSLHSYRGVVPQTEVPYLINACDVVVLPYLANAWGDYTYPNKLAEYIACGVPVVATSVSGFATVLAGASQGLCPPGDPAAMAQAITAQLESPVVLPTDDVSSWEALAEELDEALNEAVT